MILSDGEILYRGSELIQPFDKTHVQPGSYDVTLGDTYLIPKDLREMTPERDMVYMEPVATASPVFRLGEDIPQYDSVKAMSFTIQPYQFVLATTVETIITPKDVTAFVHGRSSVGRAGLFVQNAGLIDAGFVGQITLELFNASANPIQIRCGQRIAQITFERMDDASHRPYNGKYQNQVGATGTRMHDD